MGGMRFNVTVDYIGNFVMAKKKLFYIGGEKHRIYNVDTDTWLHFEAVNIIKKFKYVGQFTLWWKPSNKNMVRDLKLFILDKDAIELVNFVAFT